MSRKQDTPWFYLPTIFAEIIDIEIMYPIGSSEFQSFANGVSIPGGFLWWW